MSHTFRFEASVYGITGWRVRYEMAEEHNETKTFFPDINKSTIDVALATAWENQKF